MQPTCIRRVLNALQTATEHDVAGSDPETPNLYIHPTQVECASTANVRPSVHAIWRRIPIKEAAKFSDAKGQQNERQAGPTRLRIYSNSLQRHVLL